MPPSKRRIRRQRPARERSGAYKLGSEALQRDAAALFSFVDSICLHAREDRRPTQYLQPSRKFFEYVRELGDGTKAYLNTFAANAPKDRRLYQDYRQKLETIRSGWFELHELIKPAIDADTLSVPYTLIEALTTRLHEISGFDRTIFAIFHFDELNYLEMPISEIKKTTDRLERIIPSPPVFPSDTGLIGIPYSQSSSIYLNCLIAHEMGHFVFEKLQLKGKKLLMEIETSLKKAFGSSFSLVSSEDLDWSKERLESWAEEVFCDLFAVWLVGPCYTFAYIEVFGLTTILDPTSGFKVTAGSIVFTGSHPADLFRLGQQTLLLKELGWWRDIVTIKSHYVGVLSAALGVSAKEYEFSTRKKAYVGETLQAFLLLAPFLTVLIKDVMKGSGSKAVDCGLNEYRKMGKGVGQYLEQAVVPSTVFIDGQHWYPATVTLLNASMRFYLESLEKLMSGIEDQKPSLPGHRSNWIKRLESLTAKAIEDHYLLVKEKGSVQVGGAFKRADLGQA